MVPNDADLSVSQSRWKLFFLLMVLAAVASLASIPFEIASLSHELAEVPWWAPIVAFLFGFIPTVAAAALGLATIATTTFDLPILKWMVHRQPEPERNKWTIIVRSFVWGTATFLVVHGFSQWMEPLLVPELAAIVREKRPDATVLTPIRMTLLSFAAGVREEIIFRFGFLTFLVWIGTKLFRIPKTNSFLFWIANLLATIPFGLAHLMNAVSLEIPITSALIAAILISNGGVGLMCGWLYRKYGIESAIIAHIQFDFIQFVVWPLLSEIAG